MAIKMKLGKLKMPEKKALDLEDLNTEEAVDDLDEEAPMHEEADMEEEEAAPLKGEESAEEEAAELDMIPDEELLAEIKKRGLMNQLMKNEEAEEEEEDLDMY